MHETGRWAASSVVGALGLRVVVLVFFVLFLLRLCLGAHWTGHYGRDMSAVTQNNVLRRHSAPLFPKVRGDAKARQCDLVTRR
ncbi:hypothetical protein B0H19DRAFT_1111003 [Mycena capillaripes]|nr:hypothetical protein B0H19DRAFT_1111003 [Mycena capillaripes]